MASVRITLTQTGEARVKASLARLSALGADPTPLMREIAGIGEARIRESFATETAPDGSAWEPSLRQQVSGGKTLTKDGHLGDSADSIYSARDAEFGVNRIYSNVHQFGAVIKPVKAARLIFALPGGGTASAKEVTIPARPFIGLNDEDIDDIEDTGGRLIKEVLRA